MQDKTHDPTSDFPQRSLDKTGKFKVILAENPLSCEINQSAGLSHTKAIVYSPRGSTSITSEVMAAPSDEGRGAAGDIYDLGSAK